MNEDIIVSKATRRVLNDERDEGPHILDVREVWLLMPDGENRLLWRAPWWKRVYNVIKDWRAAHRRK